MESQKNINYCSGKSEQGISAKCRLQSTSSEEAFFFSFELKNNLVWNINSAPAEDCLLMAFDNWWLQQTTTICAVVY